MKDKYSFFSNLFFLIKNWFKKDTFGAIVVFVSAIIYYEDCRKFYN